MRLEPVDATDPRDVLRALRAALGGSGPALALGAASASTGAAPAVTDEDRVSLPAGTVAVVTTSGSTGYPKSVVLSRAALTSSALATFERIGSGRWLLALPAAYVAGLQVLVRSLVGGTEPAIVSGAFSPAAFAAAARTMISVERGAAVPRYTALVPAQLTALLDAAESDRDVREALRSFEAILVGGQSLPARVRERAADVGAVVVRTYGSTETSGGCVYDGRPLDGVSVRTMDGEVQIAGPVLAEGYFGDAARTAEAFVRDDDGRRWYRTGDAGGLVGEELRVTGRLDNVIVSGGVNVSLDRVEAVVRSIDAFEHAIVVGAEDRRWGEVPIVVVPGGGGARDDALPRIREVTGEQLGPAARPARIVAVDDVPLLASGKPDRRALRQRLDADAAS